MRLFPEVVAEQKQSQLVQDIGHTAASSSLGHAVRSADFGGWDRKP